MTADPSAVCFDLDDTLYDYTQYARAGLAHAAEYLADLTGEQCHDELERLYFDAEVTEGTFDVFLDRNDLPADLVSDLVERFHQAQTPLEPYSGTNALLSRLSSTYSLGLITDGRGGFAKLERLGIGPYFDVVVVTPTIASSKRERTPFQVALEELEVEPALSWYVGDDPRVDFRVPNQLGMTTIRLRRGRFRHLEAPDCAHAAECEIDSLADLPRLLAGVLDADT